MNNKVNANDYLVRLGERLKLYRVSMGYTQQDLEDRSGVSKRSISRMELGESMQLDNFIKVLIALKLDGNIDILIPDQTKRPSYYLEPKKKGPQRVRKTNVKKTNVKKTNVEKTNADKNEFVWGDEE